MFEFTGEATILALRLALLAALYLFLGLVVLAAGRELRRAGRTVAPRGAPFVNGSSARLTVVDPGATSLQPGAVLPLRTTTRLGRSEVNTIVLDDTFVSSEHAVIVQRNGAWWLADQGSRNGTLVNERPVRGEIALATGDLLTVGDVRLRVTT